MLGIDDLDGKKVTIYFGHGANIDNFVTGTLVSSPKNLNRGFIILKNATNFENVELRININSIVFYYESK